MPVSESPAKGRNPVSAWNKATQYENWIRFGPDGSAAELLGRHVRRRSEQLPGVGQRAVARELFLARLGRGLDRAVGRQPEVDDPHATIGADDHVVRLEVAVHQAGFVRRGESLTGLAKDPEDLGPRSLGPVEPLTQILAGHQLHRDEGVALVLADLVDRDHVGMRQLGEGPGPPDAGANGRGPRSRRG